MKAIAAFRPLCVIGLVSLLGCTARPDVGEQDGVTLTVGGNSLSAGETVGTTDAIEIDFEVDIDGESVTEESVFLVLIESLFFSQAAPEVATRVRGSVSDVCDPARRITSTNVKLDSSKKVVIEGGIETLPCGQTLGVCVLVRDSKGRDVHSYKTIQTAACTIGRADFWPPYLLPENTSTAMTIGHFPAKDQAGRSLTYTLLDDENGHFSIEGYTLKSVAGKTFDYETKSLYSISARVENGAGEKPIQTYKIQLFDLNEPPTSMSLSNAATGESVAADTLIGTLSTIDVDTSDTHTYTFTGVNGNWGGRFAIVGNQLRRGAAGAINDPSYVIEILSTDSGGYSINESFTIEVDAAPRVTSVTSTVDTTGGLHRGIGTTIPVSVVFSEPVIVTGTPRLLLETGAVDRFANYVSGSGTTTLVFEYTVQSGDANADLNYGDVDALALNGGRIRDNAGTTAFLTLPDPTDHLASSLGANKDFIVDGVIGQVTSVDSPADSPAYFKQGDPVTIRVHFSEPVNVTGTPRLALAVGGATVQANCAAASGVVTMSCAFVVASGQNEVDLDYASSNALALNGGTINDLASNPVSLTLPPAGQAHSLSANEQIVIDTVVPELLVTGSPSADGPSNLYKLADGLTITAQFSEAVVISGGTPSLSLNSGGSAVLSGGSGTATLAFSYTVGSGETTRDLDISAFNLNGATISDLAGNMSVLALPTGSDSLGGAKAIDVDGIVPQVTNVTSPDSGYKVQNDTVTIQISFSEDLELDGTLELDLQTGTATCDSMSGHILTCTYSIQSGDLAPDLDYTTIDALSLVGGSRLFDSHGNTANLSLPTPSEAGSLSHNVDINVDAVVPTVQNVTSTASAAYHSGQSIPITVLFSEPVIVTSGLGAAPTLLLNTGRDGATAEYTGATETELSFSYLVVAPDAATDLDYVGTGSLDLGSYTITDLAGNPAAVLLPTPGAAGSLSANRDIIIDTDEPQVLRVVSETATKKIGDVVSIGVVFDDSISVSGGSPRLRVDLGSRETWAAFQGLIQTTIPNDTLQFSFTVESGDSIAPLNYTATTALDANGSTITDVGTNAAALNLPALDSADALQAANVVIDGIRPLVDRVYADGAYNATFKVADTIQIKVEFDSDVVVVGSPKLLLETGAEDRYATFVSEDAGTLTFSYSVQVGDISSDLDQASANALELADGESILDVAGNSAVTTLPGGGQSLAGQNSIVVDGVAPYVTGVSSGTADGVKNENDSVAIRVMFNEVILVSGGVPTLVLETGINDAVVSCSHSPGTAYLDCPYTVAAGHQSADLDYVASNSLATTGVTIADAAGNVANAALPEPGAAGSLSHGHDFVVRGSDVTVVSVTSAVENGIKGLNIQIPIQVVFSGPVSVTGSPRIELNTNSAPNGFAVFDSGSGTSTLTFAYTVALGQSSADLDYVDSESLQLNGGTILDFANSPAVRTLPDPGTPHSLGANKDFVIDGLAPSVVEVTSAVSGVRTIGTTIPISVVFTETVTVTGVPKLLLETGDTNREAAYVSGSGTATLVFNYTVQENDVSADLDYASTNALTVVDASIVDADLNDAVLDLDDVGGPDSLGGNSNIVVDGVRPIVANVSSDSADGAKILDDSIAILVTFSENVFVTGTPELTLDTGATDRAASYVGGSGTNVLEFTYTVQAGDVSSDLNYASTAALVVGAGGAIRDSDDDTYYNAAVLTLPALDAAESLAGNKAFVVDGIVPSVTDVTSSTPPGMKVWGESIVVLVEFSETVTVAGGTPRLELALSSGNRWIDYTGGSGTDTLVFTYDLQLNDRTADGVNLDYTNSSALDLNGATIRDAAGNAADVDLPVPGVVGDAESLGLNRSLQVDAVAPVVTDITSSATNGRYRVGSTAITVLVRFSESITVTGTPTLTLETGADDVAISFTGITSTGGGSSNTMNFSYSVSAGHNSSDLDLVAENAFSLAGGSVRAVRLTGGFTNPAVLSSYPIGAVAGSLSTNKAIVIDTEGPGVLHVTSSTANGTLTLMSAATPIQVVFSEAVIVSGTPALQLETGNQDASLTYTSGSGTSVLTFNYVVGPGQNSADLNYRATNSLTGTITDLATVGSATGNSANLTLPNLDSENSLAGMKEFVVDGIRPIVQTVTSSLADGRYKIGDTVSMTLEFGETVTVDGTPRVRSNITGAAFFNYASGTGTTALTFTYVVQEGHTSGDLDIWTTHNLTDGSVFDANGNPWSSSSGNAWYNNDLLAVGNGLPHGVLSAARAIIVDGVRPGVSDQFTTPFQPEPGPVPSFSRAGGNRFRFVANESIKADSVSNEDLLVWSTCGVTLDAGGPEVSGNLVYFNLAGTDGCGENDIMVLSAFPAGMEDLAGNSSAHGQYSASYTIDATGPDVTSISPATSDQEVLPTNVLVAFSSDVKASTVTGADFSVGDTCADGNVSVGSVTTNGNVAIVTLANANVCVDTETVTLTVQKAGIADIAGNAGTGTTAATWTKIPAVKTDSQAKNESHNSAEKGDPMVFDISQLPDPADVDALSAMIAPVVVSLDSVASPTPRLAEFAFELGFDLPEAYREAIEQLLTLTSRNDGSTVEISRFDWATPSTVRFGVTSPQPFGAELKLAFGQEWIRNLQIMLSDDFNGDGLSDALSVDSDTGNLMVDFECLAVDCERQRTVLSSFSRSDEMEHASPPARAFWAGDIDGDGFADIAIVDPAFSVLSLRRGGAEIKAENSVFESMGLWFVSSEDQRAPFEWVFMNDKNDDGREDVSLRRMIDDDRIEQLTIDAEELPSLGRSTSEITDRTIIGESVSN